MILDPPDHQNQFWQGSDPEAGSVVLAVVTRPGESHLVPEVLDGVLQGQDVAEEWTLERVPQVPQSLAVGPLLPLDQFGLETLQSSQNLLPVHGGH